MSNDEIRELLEKIGTITYRSAPKFMSHEERCGYAAGWNSLLRKILAAMEGVPIGLKRDLMER